MHSNEQLPALRKAYKKNLLANIGTALLSILAGAILLGNRVYILSIEWGIALGLAVVLAAVEYIIERALYKKGKNVSFLLTGFLLGLMGIFMVLWKLNVLGAYTYLFWPLILGFMLIRPLIPAVGLLRDLGRLRTGDLCETVGRMKKGTRRREASVGRESYLLFEDELTHESHLLRMGSISPLHRYRVFYLPHSGLAVGEAIADNVTFDPFGNPIEREVTEETAKEAFSYAVQDSYAKKPDYVEDEDYTEKSTYNDDGGYAAKPPYVEDEAEVTEKSYDYPEDGKPDPNSPERQKAAKYATASKVCKVLSLAGAGLLLLVSLLSGEGFDAAIGLLCLVPFILFSILHTVFKNKELKLRCTIRTTAHCIYTVRRRSGKSSHLHPVVEYEVEGVTHTAELSVSCTRHAVGELYTIYYDPLDPNTVRAE